MSNRLTFVSRHRWVESILATLPKTHKHVLISDLDDTILNSSIEWFNLFKSLHKNNLLSPNFKLFNENGARFYFTKIVDDYDAVKMHYMHDPEFNSNLGILPIAKKIKKACVNGYLTTRPFSLAGVTLDNIIRISMPPRPTLFRGPDIHYNDTLRFKISSLIHLRSEMDNRGLESIKLYYIDDYAELIDSLNNYSVKFLFGLHTSERRFFLTTAKKQ